MIEHQQVRVGTLNLRNTSDRWSERRSLLFEQLSELGPDILGLQELRRPSLQSRMIQRAANAESDGSPYHLYPAWKTGLRRFWEGIGVLTELPVIEASEIDLRSGDRVAQRVSLALDDGTLLDFYNTHLSHAAGAADERLRQIEIIMRHIRARSGRPHVVVGDLNAVPDEPAIRLLASEMKSAYAAVHGQEPNVTVPSPLSRTWGQEDDKVIDYIFVSREISVLDAWITFDRVADDDDRLTASDHFGIAANIIVNA